MSHNSRLKRKWIALAIWFTGLVLAAGLGIWNFNSVSSDADNRLISEATRAAGELANFFSVHNVDADSEIAHALIDGAMEDERIYAVKITVDHKMLDGQRRNYLWEPIPWDDEIAEHSIQGMNPVKIDGRSAGHVEVWISTRTTNEEKTILLNRETWRFVLFALLWTIPLLLLFWQWGELGKIINKFSARHENTEEDSDRIILGLTTPEKTVEEKEKIVEPVNAVEGRRHQHANPDSWFVTAGMFRQTFARGPKLISRLYSDGEIAGLCHLGRMLEQAAPCVGASRLLEAAKNMQKSLNNPESNSDAIAVDECVKALEEVLDALCGEGQWRSGAKSAGDR